MLFMFVAVYWARLTPESRRCQLSLLVAALTLVTLPGGPHAGIVYADDRLLREPGMAAIEPSSGNDLGEEDEPLRSSGPLLREGTRIPPTTGQVMPVGRQWAFVPTTSPQAAGGEPAAEPSTARFVLVENLMLQRIVEAIRADSRDNSWLLSGEVTEFFQENRLLIRTAQRAASSP
jgi:hypothetical protein